MITRLCWPIHDLLIDSSMYTPLPSFFNNILVSPISPFMTISMCWVVHYFNHPVFSISCHVFSQLVFRHVFFLYVVPPSVFDPSILILQEMSNLSNFAQMWLCSRVKHCPTHFSLLISMKVILQVLCPPPS